METPSQLDTNSMRHEGSAAAKAAAFPEEAFQFVREGLQHTVKVLHGAEPAAAKLADPYEPSEVLDESRHVSGQQLCLGLRDMAIERYGLLASTVLNHWGIHRTDDFGVIVYRLIERGELRASDNDTLTDFRGVYTFDQAFPRTLMR